ncbi:MAG: hypothetical protein RL308_2368, partial [Bacteroidota bacterium]
METPFKNKVALVTGAASGIGSATAIMFAQKGAQVVLADWQESTKTLDKIKAFGGEAIAIKCDVSKLSEVKNMIEGIILVFGRLDYAFNNAGIEGVNGSIQECTEENWDKTISINLKGIWACMKYEIPEML